MHQVFKERAIMDHRLTQILGIGLPACMAYGDVMGRTIILYNFRVINGQVG